MAYDPAGTECAKGPQPGATALMKWCLGAFPDARNLGIFICRQVRNGSTLSVHAEGRALDVGFPVVDGKANPLGIALAELLVRHAAELGVQLVIWNRRIWSALHAGDGWRLYGGTAGPHLDHLHIELCWDAARHLTGTRINEVLEETAAPPEDELTADEHDAVMTANHFVKVIWPKEQERIARIEEMLEVLVHGTQYTHPVPQAVTQIHTKLDA